MCQRAVGGRFTWRRSDNQIRQMQTTQVRRTIGDANTALLAGYGPTSFSIMRVLAAVLLLLTGHAEAWGSSPKKAATRESPAAAAEVCANPSAGADDRLTRQVQQLAETVGAQAARIAQLERALAARPTKPTKPAPARKGAPAAVAPAASLAELQPELQPFRLAEAQRALRRQQAQLA